MSDYISKAQVLETYAELYDVFDDNHKIREVLHAVYEKINNLAPLKEQETKTGHWVSVNDGDVVAIDNDGFPERACFCSECKKYLIASDEYAVYGKFCPFCGAKMEGSVK